MEIFGYAEKEKLPMVVPNILRDVPSMYLGAEFFAGLPNIEAIDE